VEWRWRVWRNREEVGRGGRQHFLTSSPSESSWWFRPEKALSRESLLTAPESTCGDSSSHKRAHFTRVRFHEANQPRKIFGQGDLAPGNAQHARNQRIPITGAALFPTRFPVGTVSTTGTASAALLRQHPRSCPHREGPRYLASSAAASAHSSFRRSGSTSSMAVPETPPLSFLPPPSPALLPPFRLAPTASGSPETDLRPGTEAASNLTEFGKKSGESGCFGGGGCPCCSSPAVHLA